MAEQKQQKAETGLSLKLGSYEEGKKWIGKEGDAIYATDPVGLAQIHRYCALNEDGNPLYWDEEYAKRTRFGGIIAPNAMLMVHMIGGYWEPTWMPKAKGQAATADLPLPGDTVINTNSLQEYFRPVRPGDRLWAREKIADITTEKKTRLGVGHFITTVTSYYNQYGDVVATNTNTLYRFKSDTGS